MAFPTVATILDTFNRADEDPAVGWGSTFNNIEIFTNAAGINNAAGAIAYWSATTYGPDSEAYFDISVKPPNGTAVAVLARMVQVTSVTTIDCYSVSVTPAAGTDAIVIQRVDNAVGTTLGAGLTQEITNGDGIGIQIVGSTIYAFYRSGAGAWVELANRSDATYSAAGNIGTSGASTTTRIDNFGGGTFLPTGTRLKDGTKLRKMSLVN